LIVLLGTIEAGPDSVALFGMKSDLLDLSVARRKGADIGGYRVKDVAHRGVVLAKDGKIWILRPGDLLDGIESGGPIKIKAGMEREGSTIRVSKILHDYVTRDGLLSILNQAASEKVEGGYRIFDIDPGSAFDLAGFKDGDIVSAIDGVELTNPFTAMKMLVRAKDASKFSFTVVRRGREETVDVEVLR
jgi:membrane-associated protease RseP (regulator of RpoE activity)